MVIELMEDEDFKTIFPPLTKEKYDQLKDSIDRRGFDKDFPIAMWNGVIIDGYNRYKACQELGIEPITVDKEFATIEEAITWVYTNQFTRRSLTPIQEYYVIGVRYRKEKNLKGTVHTTEMDKKAKDLPFENTAERLGKEFGKSHQYVKDAEKFANSIDELAKEEGITPYEMLDILSGGTKVTKLDIDVIMELPIDDRKKVVEEIKKGIVNKAKVILDKFKKPKKPTKQKETGEDVDSTPVNGTPVDSTPVNGTPVDSTPVKGTPVNGTTIEKTTEKEKNPRDSVDGTTTIIEKHGNPQPEKNNHDVYTIFSESVTARYVRVKLEHLYESNGELRCDINVDKKEHYCSITPVTGEENTYLIIFPNVKYLILDFQTIFQSMSPLIVNFTEEKKNLTHFIHYPDKEWNFFVEKHFPKLVRQKQEVVKEEVKGSKESEAKPETKLSHVSTPIVSTTIQHHLAKVKATRDRKKDKKVAKPVNQPKKALKPEFKPTKQKTTTSGDVSLYTHDFFVKQKKAIGGTIPIAVGLLVKNTPFSIPSGHVKGEYKSKEIKTIDFPVDAMATIKQYRGRYGLTTCEVMDILVSANIENQQSTASRQEA